jgi:hypothetical protein
MKPGSDESFMKPNISGSLKPGSDESFMKPNISGSLRLKLAWMGSFTAFRMTGFQYVDIV